MPKYLVPVRLIKLGYAEIEGDTLDDAIQDGTRYAEISGQRDSDEGWFYDGSEQCKKWNEEIDDWVDVGNEEEE